MILHQFSLLHALSMQCLRLDNELDNLVVFNRTRERTREREGRYAVGRDALLSAVNAGHSRELVPSNPEDRGGSTRDLIGQAEALQEEDEEAEEAEALAAAEVAAMIDIESGLADVGAGLTRRGGQSRSVKLLITRNQRTRSVRCSRFCSLAQFVTQFVTLFVTLFLSPHLIPSSSPLV